MPPRMDALDLDHPPPAASDTAKKRSARADDLAIDEAANARAGPRRAADAQLCSWASTTGTLAARPSMVPHTFEPNLCAWSTSTPSRRYARRGGTTLRDRSGNDARGKGSGHPPPSSSANVACRPNASRRGSSRSDWVQPHGHRNRHALAATADIGIVEMRTTRSRSGRLRVSTEVLCLERGGQVRASL